MRVATGITLAATLTLAACGSQKIRDNALRIALDEPGLATGGQFPRFVPLLEAGQGPALDVVLTDFGVRGGFLRESRRGTIETWLGNDGISLIFDRGVLHGTRGIGAGLLTSDVSAVARAVLSGHTGQVERLHTYLDGNDKAETRAYLCDIRNEGAEVITLDNRRTPTRRMSETCNNLDQSFVNTYWVDPRRGSIVKSRQWSGETAGQLEITKVFDF